MAKDLQNRLAIFDLDGTLVDVNSIRHHVEGKKKNFDLFHKESIDCPPNEKVLFLNKTLAMAQDIYIAIFTGREEKYRGLSEQWLHNNKVTYHCLLMRQDNDFRSNVIIKHELFENFKSNYLPYLAIDDTPELRKLWGQVGFINVYDPINFDHQN